MSDLQENSTDDQEVSMIIKLMTLNCWGLYGVSKFRTQRMEAIGNFVADSNFDMVVLQEVWCQEDFDRIQKLSQQNFPYSHYFDYGIVGTGICIFTKVSFYSLQWFTETSKY